LIAIHDSHFHFLFIGDLSGVSLVTKARWWMVEKSFIWAAEAAFGTFPILH
jgi:hypothetical protein